MIIRFPNFDLALPPGEWKLEKGTRAGCVLLNGRYMGADYLWSDSLTCMDIREDDYIRWLPEPPAPGYPDLLDSSLDHHH